MDNSSKIPENNEGNRPKWLEILETESWQPELLISGLAIVASIQFSAYIEDLHDYLLFNFDETARTFGSYLILYLDVASYAIALNFSIHFVIRVFWIGVLGLMSVYPEGIRFENYPYGNVHFVERLKAKLRSLRGFSLHLDRICSIIFSFSSLIVLSLVSTTILVGSFWGVVMVVKLLLPEYYTSSFIRIVFYCIAAIFSVFLLSTSIFNYTKLKHTKLAEKVHFPLYWFFSSLFFNILNRPFHYLSLTFATNAKMTLVSFFIFIYMTLLSAFFVFKTVNSQVGFETRSYYATDSNAFALADQHYDNLRSGEKHIRVPSLSSDVVEENYLKIFIPYQKYLDEKLEKICYNASLEGKKDTLSKDEFERNRIHTFRHLQCFRSLYSMELNNQPLLSIEWQFYEHANKGEKGMIHYLLTDSLPKGKNVLRVEQLSLEEGKEGKQWEIPFWK